jgi:hydrogenase maturation protein HypF
MATEDGPLAIAPDLATCAACVADVLDPRSRRHRYPFTSCTSCGPGLTIATGAPFDRAHSTMVGFAMCDACRAEHDDPASRRHHAAAIACPACGPRVVLEGDDGEGEPIARAAARLREGRIVAVKSLGGYELVCDARHEEAVAAMRARKQREAKPFAVMVASVEAASELGVLDDAARSLLSAPAHPIVLVPRRPDSPLAPSVSSGVGDAGLMLPVTALHHLILREVGGPIVVTSANVANEPIAYRDDDARERLAGMADCTLTHDREIRTSCDDSVVRIADGAPMILRRARGYAPLPLRLPVRLARPTLALGGQRDAAFIYGVENVAFASPHLGDLDELATYERFVAALEHYRELSGIKPEQVVRDMHPDYATTRLAEHMGLATIAVQHHHAHFASAFADARLHGPAIGVIFNTSGYGADGTIWGGELLVGDTADVWRAAHLQNIPQPGEDPWRMAVAYLAGAGEPYADVHPDAEHVAGLCGRAPRTSSMGRLFDAVAAIAGIVAHNAFEGHASMYLEGLARTAGPEPAYPFELSGDELVVTAMIRAIARDVAKAVSPARIARRFHTTIVELTAHACAQLAHGEGLRDVVLSGGVFQNAILAAELPARLRALGLVPHLQRRMPPGDGGLAFGQLAVAAARDAG